jgi:hypothetical protein
MSAAIFNQNLPQNGRNAQMLNGTMPPLSHHPSSYSQSHLVGGFPTPPLAYANGAPVYNTGATFPSPYPPTTQSFYNQPQSRVNTYGSGFTVGLDGNRAMMPQPAYSGLPQPQPYQGTYQQSNGFPQAMPSGYRRGSNQQHSSQDSGVSLSADRSSLPSLQNGESSYNQGNGYNGYDQKPGMTPVVQASYSRQNSYSSPGYPVLSEGNHTNGTNGINGLSNGSQGLSNGTPTTTNQGLGNNVNGMSLGHGHGQWGNGNIGGQ